VTPLYVFALPKERKRHDAIVPVPENRTAVRESDRERPAVFKTLFGLVALVLTISSMITSLVSVHLLVILQAHNIAPAMAVALGAIVGPSQVGARAIELVISHYHHPIWTKLASTIFVATGVGALWAGLPLVSVALVFYGAGIGIESIARGTLPLVLFGEHRYAAIMCQIAMPSLIAQAASPSLGAILIERFGASGMLAALFAVAITNVVLVGTLFALLPRTTLSATSV
jgi:hypothetical protein